MGFNCLRTAVDMALQARCSQLSVILVSMAISLIPGVKETTEDVV